ncbi:MAG: hypothetical protein OES34_12045 [Nitrosopumilus sp.]|nr:hypothetical protein [Nitrosopumilus sp.]
MQGNKSTLSIEDKISILCEKDTSLRQGASHYGVHHSSIDAIRKEGEEALRDYWAEKSTRRGRPRLSKDGEKEEVKAQSLAQEQFEKKLALKQMRIDWLELQLKWERERAAERDSLRSQKQLKKKKKKRK